MSELKLTLEELAPFCDKFNKDQLQQALNICLQYQLTPLKRQIHFSLRNKKVGKEYVPSLTYLVTVDGLRGIAERSDKYQGQVGPFWCGQDGVWSDVWLKPSYPVAAKVGVNKAGFREPLYAVAKFAEYSQKNDEGKPQQMWAKMPDAMVAKCAEALALRRAFPDETSGLYTVEEMQQAENPPAVTRPQPNQPATQQKRPEQTAQTTATAPQETKTESPHNELPAGAFSMAGEPDPNCPFTNSQDRKNWMVDVKTSLELVGDDDELAEWLSAHGGHIKWLGNMQQKAMNELINSKKAAIGNAAMDRKARV